MTSAPVGPAPAAIRLLVDGPAPGAWNMAVDQALMEAARRGVVTLRFYLWEPPCLSLGRNQPGRGAYDEGAAAARGVEIVRRPTGGRAVYHHRELTYAVTAPAELWGSLRCACARIHRAVGRGLARARVPVALAAGMGRAPSRRPPAPLPRACFREPAPGEVTLLGRKLVGSAQWRHAGALLQHGSILLVDEQRTADALRLPAASAVAVARAAAGSGPPAGSEAAVPASIGLREACASPPSLRRLVRDIGRGFGEEFGLPVARGKATAGELAEARRLETAYRSREWTWRR